VCAYMQNSVGVCSIGLSVAFSAVCVLKSCGSVCLRDFELSVCGGVVGVCAYVSVAICSVGRSVAGRAVCELRSCGSVCLCVCGSMQYWPVCGVWSCLCVEELWECVLMCLYEYAVLAIGLSVSE
jgi:hypothetical protein